MNKLRKFIFLIFIITLTITCALGTTTKAKDTTKRLKVSVFKFRGDTAEKYRESAANILSKTLYKFGRFKLINRQEIDRILEEQHFQKTGLVDQSEAVKIGKLASVNIGVIGTINNLSADYKSGGYYEAKADITVKFIDIESGKVVHIIENDISASADDKENAKQEALNDCFGHTFLVKLRKKYSLYSNIVKVRDDIVYFLNGKELGVKKGSKYKVLREEATSAELDLEDESKMRKKIGVIKVTKVTKNAAKAKIIWASEKIRRGDLVKEAISGSNNQIKLEISPSSTSLTDQYGETTEDGSLTYKFHYGWETPYEGESSFYFGLSPMEELMVYDLGFQFGKEVAINPGKTYLSFKGSSGLAMARQEYNYSYYSGTASAKSFHFGGSAGMKIYTSHTGGPRLEFGVNYKIGPNFSDNWTYADYIPASYGVEYPEADFSGLGFYCSLTIPFGLGSNKEKSMDMEDIDENIKKTNEMLENIEDITGY